MLWRPDWECVISNLSHASHSLACITFLDDIRTLSIRVVCSLPPHARMSKQKAFAFGASPDIRSPAMRRYIRGELSSTRYQEFRARHLRHHPLCVHCKRAGRISLATELDHIVRRVDGGAVYDEANVQGLCHDCHLAKSRGERGWRPALRRIGIDGYPIDDDGMPAYGAGMA